MIVAGRRLRCTLAAIAALSAIAACGPADPGRVTAPTSAAVEDEPAPSGPAATRAASEEPVPIAIVTAPDALAAIAGRADLGVVLGSGPAPTTRALSAGPWSAMADALTDDLRRIESADPRAGVGIRGHPHRVFDARWLRSEHTAFELVAVVNRLDRRPFQRDACGETRLVYRLAYATQAGGETVRSRLPMTVNVELRAAAPASDGSCRDAAARWLAPSDVGDSWEWLTAEAGPLAPELLTTARIAQVVVNLQSVRWPSTVRPDMAGHAEYVLRAFGADGAPQPLENTPDLARLRRDRAAREALVSWIRQPEHLAAIDAGTAVLPERFLATTSTSVTPLGLSRRANRPFRQLLDPAQLGDLDLAPYQRIGSPEALVRRLDDLSCAGCHQSRSVAGFHILGEDGDEVVAGNAIAVPFSPHVSQELVRRRRVLDAVLSDATPDWSRGFAERGGLDDSGYGARCGLGDPGFRAWTCDDGLRCDAHGAGEDEAVVGTCLPDGPGAEGDPCETGRVRPHDDPHRDRVVETTTNECRSGLRCNDNRLGFPGGMCTGGCAGLSDAGACGVIAAFGPFNACLGRGTPFPQCLRETVRPAALRRCSVEAPCRDDYLCARAPDGGGTCVPPYFLFQLRVDGHPPG